jgi:surface carbohydrate biosynthesis protein (TIGR04326 family)
MKKLMLWCSPEHSPPPGNFTVYWAQYISERERKVGNISLPEVINEDESYWRPRYLSWLETVGKSPCGATTVVETLLIRPGLSYWWMTIPSEYSFSTTSIAYATLRLWALVQIADAHHVEELRVHGADADLEETLTLWCKKTGCQITFIRGHGPNNDESQIQTASSHIKRRLPPLISGLGYLVHQYLRYFTWRRHKLSSETTDDPAFTVVDYFANLDVEVAQKGIYASNYWGPLTQILPQLGTSVRWIHIDAKSAALPDVRSARAAIRGLNRDDSSSRHVLIHDYFTLRVAFKSAVQYLRIRKITKQFATRISWVDTVSGLDLYPLVRSCLHSDFRGSGAVSNALWISLFEEALPSQPTQGSCIYLMENQPWELALLHARMTQGRGLNIGVAHVPVRTWDLRYAMGSSGISAENGRTLPTASRVAVIDPKSEAVMLTNGLEPSAISKVEALRFLSHASASADVTSNQSATLASKRVLAFGEYDALMCAKQLQILEELVPLAGDKYAFTFRPHPAKPFLQESLPTGVSLSEAVTAGEDIVGCNVALCSNVSSASLDAHLEGIPILMFRDGRLFDGSLLDAGPTMQYINSANDVLSVLERSEFVVGSTSVDGLYPMYLDIGLIKWKALLTSIIGHGNAQASSSTRTIH